MIIFSDVTKYYDKKRVLCDFSLIVKKGELTFITGNSGAGKTTLLKLIFCSERADSGKIVVDDWEVSKLRQRTIPHLRRNIGIVFQEFKLFFNKNVYENVALPLQFNGIPSKKISGYVNEMLEKVGLLKTANEFPQYLSGGEQQRIVIARSMVSKPKLVLADEPTGNLDTDNAKSIMNLFKEINEKGTTVLIATHNKELFQESGHRVLYLNNSIIERDYRG